MNPWLLIGPIAPLLWSLAAIIDKYLVTRYFGGVNSDGSNSSGSVGSFILFSSLLAGIICIPLLVLIDGIFQISIKDMAFLVAGGVFGVTCVILYLIALQEEELSLIVPWWQTIPLFGYLFGYLFLGEAMTKGQFIAGAIILIGASILSIDFRKKFHFRKKIAFLMLGSSVSYAIGGLFFKIATPIDSFWISVFWEHVGILLVGICLYTIVSRYRNDFLHVLKTQGSKILGLNVLNETLNTGGVIITNFTTLTMPLALGWIVTNGIQPFILFILTIMLTLFIPSILKEDVGVKNLLPKCIGTAIMITGTFLLFFLA